MRTPKILELLNEGKIDELKKQLEDELYQQTLNRTPGAKQRYTAMKQYFKYTNHAREILQKPARVTFEGEDYISFTNSWSLALTKEDIGELELYEGNYPDVVRLLRFDGVKKKINYRKLIAEAKTKGYKLTKSEVGPKFQYLLSYDGAYYKIGLIDLTFRIIDDGEIPITYHPEGQRLPITIKNDIGLCVIMPVKYEGDPEEDGYTVIHVD